jgi:dihydrofolate reductase
MKTIYYTAASLDGFLADPENSLEWLFQFQPPGGEDHYEAFVQHVGALAMGSTTYDWLLNHEIFPEGGTPRPWFYSQPSWVFSSRSLRVVEGADIRFARGDVRPVHAEMLKAAGGKNLWIVGGGELAGQFYDHGLLDEIVISFASVTLGAGAPLLPRRIIDPPLKLLSARQWGDGFAVLKYAVPKPGA